MAPVPLDQAWSIPNHKCPQCTRVLHWASGVQNDSRPAPGDSTICSECGCISTFTAGLDLRRATPAEIEEALEPEVCRRAYEVLLSIIKRNGP